MSQASLSFRRMKTLCFATGERDLGATRDMAKETATSDSPEFRVSVATVRGALPDFDRPLSS